MLTVAGKDRVELALDVRKGEEAVVLSVYDGGTPGLLVRAKQSRSTFLGASPASLGRVTTSATSGLLLLHGDTRVHACRRKTRRSQNGVSGWRRSATCGL